MEQTNSGECHCNSVFVAGFNDVVVADRTAGLCNKSDTATVSALNVVSEREERVRAESYTSQSIQPGTLFFSGERFGLFGKKLLPNTVGKHIHIIVGDIDINGVIAVRTADIGFKWEVQHLGILAQKPDVRFVSGKTSAVNTGLLTGTDADGLTVFGIANRVGLGIFRA